MPQAVKQIGKNIDNIKMSELFSGDIFAWVVLPLLIFLARIADVTIGTLRIMFVAKGNRIIAPLLGFCEVLIWLITLGRIMQNLSNPMTYIAYGAGFAMGNFVGISIENKLALGVCIIRIITRMDAENLVKSLRDAGYGITALEANGSSGRVGVLYSIIKRVNIPQFTELILEHNPKAFYTIEDVRFVNQGVFPVTSKALNRPLRKGK